MRRHILLGSVAIASALTLTLTACGSSGDDDSKEVKVLGTDGNNGQGFADKFGDDKGALRAYRGTAPMSELTGEFQDRLKGVDPNLRDFNYSAEAYDAVVITALAGQIARSSNGTDIAPFVNSVTVKGDKCTNFADCVQLIDDGKDIDYDGLSGPLAFAKPGEPARATFGIYQYDKDNKASVEEYLTSGDEANADQDTPQAPPRSQAPSGGVFKIGSLLPETGELAHLGPPMSAGVRLAVKDINEAGGVNDQNVELTQGDDGTSAQISNQTTDRLLQEDVDVIVGAAGSGQTKAVIDKITNAGVVMISPSNTSDEFTTYNDKGLYFRTAPPDVLQSRQLADLILDDGANRVGILYQNTPYGSGLAQGLRKNLIDAEIPANNVLSISYDPKARDFNSQADKIKDHDPDYIVVVGYDESASIIKKLNEKGVGPKR